MGIRSRWRAGHMKDPVSGVFRVTDWYDAHPHGTPTDTRLTGVIVADGVPPTPVEAKADHHGKWAGRDELPVTVDRADPHNFRIEWDQVITTDWQATARQRALDEATRMAGGVPAMGVPIGTPPTPATQPPGVAGLGGDITASIQQALRSVGMDPSILSSSNTTVHVGMGFDAPPQAIFAQQFARQAGASVPATGVVRAVHDVAPPGALPAGMSQADLTIDVRRPDGTTYPATTRIGFGTPARRAAIATVGTTLPLLVNPNDPGRIVIDLSRIDLP